MCNTNNNPGHAGCKCGGGCKGKAKQGAPAPDATTGASTGAGTNQPQKAGCQCGDKKKDKAAGSDKA